MPKGAIVGIIGANGAGKSTLFKMLSGEEQPDSGNISIGETVELATVDQFRGNMDESKTVFQEISDGQDVLKIGNFEFPSRAYVSRFNFKGNDQQKFVKDLSGGERNRLHLAKLLKAGGNVVLLAAGRVVAAESTGDSMADSGEHAWCPSRHGTGFPPAEPGNIHLPRLSAVQRRRHAGSLFHRNRPGYREHDSGWPTGLWCRYRHPGLYYPHLGWLSGGHCIRGAVDEHGSPDYRSLHTAPCLWQKR